MHEEVGNITCFCNYEICWWWPLNSLWLGCVEWVKNFFSILSFCSHEIDFSFQSFPCLTVFFFILWNFTWVFICHFPSLSFRTARVKTEMPFIVETFCSEVSNLELLSVLESSQREGEIGNFRSICWSLNHGLHYHEYLIHGSGVPANARKLLENDFYKWQGKLALC